MHFDPTIFAVMTGVGVVVGFVGAGGSGLALAILTTSFHVPIHVALGTCLASSVFTTLSGTVSHVREKNVDPYLGTVAGLAGVIGAFVGVSLAIHTQPERLKVLCGLVILFSVSLIYVRTRTVSSFVPSDEWSLPRKLLSMSSLKLGGIGLMAGGLSGLFGISGGPFLQLGFIGLLGIPLVLAVGTASLSLVFVGISAAVTYWEGGFIDFALLFNVVAGSMIGSYFGAKLTRRVPYQVLRFSVVSLGVLAAGMLLFF
jgi:uncharacterized protein